MSYTDCWGSKGATKECSQWQMTSPKTPTNSHPAQVKGRKDEQATTTAWSLVPPHKKPNFPAIPADEKTKTPTNCSFPNYEWFVTTKPGWQSYSEFTALLKKRWGVTNIGCIGYIDEKFHEGTNNWVVLNDSTKATGAYSIEELASLGRPPYPGGFSAYGPVELEKDSWLNSAKRRWIYVSSSGTGTGGGGPMVRKGIVDTYVTLLENQLIKTWAASNMEEHFSALFDDLAERTTMYKPNGVEYRDSEKVAALTNVQNIILVLVSLEDALTQAAFSGNGGAQDLFAKWRKDMDNTNFILTVDYVMNGLKSLKGKTILPPVPLYKPWKACDPKSPDYAKCMATPIPLEPPILPPPIENLIPGKKIEPTWEEDFWADLDAWAKYLMLTDNQLLWILGGSIPLSMYCYNVQDFSYLPAVLVPALFFNFTKDYIENTLAENQTFVNFVNTLSKDFYAIKRDLKGFINSAISIVEWTLVGGALMMGTTFLGAKIPLIEPYVMLVNFGIMGVVTIYDLWEILPWFLPSWFP